MEGNMLDHGQKFLQKQRKRKRWQKVLGVLSCLVVFCTSYALILPAITMEKTTVCGKEEHIHTESCYSVSARLICGQEEQTGEEISGEGAHVHTEECYAYDTVLVCGMEEHTHDAGCYGEPEAAPEGEVSFGGEQQPEDGTDLSEGTVEPEDGTVLQEGTVEPEDEVILPDEIVQPGDETGDLAELFVQEEPAETEEEQEYVLEAVGEDYKVQVIYGESAGIPEGSLLRVTEYAGDSEEYRARFENVNALLLNQDGSCIRRARFFDISIMDGENEIEPGSTVKVEISQSADIAEDGGDIIVTHATEEGTDVISEVELTQDENGEITTSFETESFSDYGTISAGASVTIGVGDTATLDGTSGNRNNWSFSPDGIVSYTTNGNDAVVTGVAAGTVTITHTYTNKGVSESFTVIVTDNGGSGTDDPDPSEDEVEKGASDTQGYTVTVRGNKKILADDVKLIVEEWNPETATEYGEYYSALVGDIDSALSTDTANKETVFAFLRMYHIYLSKDSGQTEYDPSTDETLGNVSINLQVTITYDTTPEGWPSGNGNLYVGHYKKINDVVSGVDISDGNSSSLGVKQMKVSGNSVTFHIQSFSVFPVAALSTGTDEGDTGGSTGGSVTIQPGTDSTYGASLAATGKNEWQIVSGQYEGNAATDKIESNDKLVRIQKNVVPTDAENEFLIYLSIDKKVSWEEVIQNSNLVVTTSGSYKKIGETYESIHGNYDEISPVGPGENEYTATVTLTRGSTVIQTITQKYYGTVPKCSNATGFLKLTINGQITYVTASTSVNLHEDGSGSGGALTYTVPIDSLESKFDFADFTVGYDGVKDVMGDYILYDTVASTGDYSTAPVYDSSTRTLTWIPVQKSGLTPVYTTKTMTTGWYLNSAELIYRVKLDVTKDGFISAGEYLKGLSTTDHPYDTNSFATLYYHWTGEAANARNTDFSSPRVRGLLYDVVFAKVDADDSLKGVEGAAFTLTDGNGNQVGQITTRSDTTVYEIAAGLPYGSYTLTETVPSGYSAVNGTTWTISLCYTDSKDNLVNCDTHGANMRNAETESGYLTIENKKTEVKIVLKKADMNSNFLSGAEFKLYDEEKNELNKDLITSGEDGVFSPAEFSLGEGTYYLEETKTPAGYNMPEGMFRLTVTSSNVSVFNYDSNTEENYSGSSANTFTVNDGTAEVIIHNSTGVELPATGGSGTLPYTFGGTGLILISGLMYIYCMRRKQERGPE